MFKFVVLLAFAAVVACSVIDNRSSAFNNLVINTQGGQVQGIEERAGLTGVRYFSWKGIPYAEPPVGNLRFRESVPHRGWSGIRDAGQHGSSCPSGGRREDYTGNEDCLFLNVYSTSIIDRRPVMVWIHGGSFTGGSGDDSTYGPDHLIGEDIVVVTINYRLGVLGFLSTGDRHAPGNYAMKDMLLALRWVQNNILNFGGDPNNVTIFGESAGGVAIHYLMLSPLSQGLFHKAIAQSGSVLSPWGFQPNPRPVAEGLGRDLGLSFTNTETLITQLRNMPVRDLIVETPGWLDLPIARGFTAMPYTPCIDAPDSTEARFLPRHPREIMNSGAIIDVPFMAGYTSDESLFMIRESVLDSDVTDILNANRHLVVPQTLWGVDPLSPAGTTIANTFHDLYLNNQPITEENRYSWTQYNTDHHFAYGIDTSLRAHLRHQSSPLYYYVFSFDGDLNLVKRALFLTAYPGAMHADDIPYLFSVSRIPSVILPSNHANVVRRRMVRLWTNFAKFGNPTPTTDALITTIWPRMTANLDYYDIGAESTAGRNPKGSRLNVWQDLFTRFGN